MRYTTILDITELPRLWSNSNACLAYLYMVLRCGYHDDDRDIITCSRHDLCSALGLTEDAARHALVQLEKYGLLAAISRGKAGERNVYRVKKWLSQIKPGKRGVAPPGFDAMAGAREVELKKQAERAKEEEVKRQLLEAFDRLDETQMRTWFDELQRGEKVTHCGIYIPPQQKYIFFMKTYIDNRFKNTET